MRRRLDTELVRRGLVASREAAQASIESGRVMVSGTIAEKSARQVDPGEPIVLVGDPPRFVSRGGEKLEAALATYEIDVQGLEAIDIGASTGGFTDCLLKRGATSVVALDVGIGQLHESLRSNARVEVYERVNVRHIGDVERLSGRFFPLVVADLSFISLKLVAPQMVRVMSPRGRLVVLIKPQFEAGRREVSKGKGVIRDPEIWERIVVETQLAFQRLGCVCRGLIASPLKGADGNVEFLGYFQRTEEVFEALSEEQLIAGFRDLGLSSVEQHDALSESAESDVSDSVASDSVALDRDVSSQDVAT